jgi:hypothetical protein
MPAPLHRTCVALLGAATLALAGCGGGDDEASQSSAKPLTKAPFIDRADAICREIKQAQRPHDDRLRALTRGADLEQIAPILEAALTETRKGRERLQALRAQAPREDRATLDAYFVAADRLLAASERLARAAKSGDRAEARRVAAGAGALSDAQQRRADEYGFADCGDVF